MILIAIYIIADSKIKFFQLLRVKCITIMVICGNVRVKNAISKQYLE